MSENLVTLEIQDHVGVVTLNDPGTLNAMGMRMLDVLKPVLAEVEYNDEIRAMLLTGAGRGFCSGANLSEKSSSADDTPPALRADTGAGLESFYHPCLLRMRDMSKPIVTAVNGVAAGVGMSFALMGDMVLAAKSAYFLQAFGRIGLIPDGGATYILPRKIGMARALELSLLAEKLPAETALEWGLINRVHDDEQLIEEAMIMAKRLADGPLSLGLMRQAFWGSLDNTYESQLQTERRLQKMAGASEDAREGILAFLEKRPAEFKGK